MRYYWEALFSVEYFPYWEFSMLMFLALFLSALIRLIVIMGTIKEMRKEIAELKEMLVMSHSILTKILREKK